MRTFARIAAATLAATLAFGTANVASAAETGHRQPAPIAAHYAPSHQPDRIDARHEGTRGFDSHRQRLERDGGREHHAGRGMMRHHHHKGEHRGDRGHCHGHTGKGERR